MSLRMSTDAGENMHADDPGRTGVGCYGYTIQSPLSFCALRPINGTPLTITEADPEWTPSGAPEREWRDRGIPFARLWAGDGSYTLWIDQVGWFGIDPATPAITVPSSLRGPRREVRLWGLPMALCFLKRGDLSLHAAAIDVDGRAVILAAPGRHGKTTLAAAFVQAGYRLLSEDLTCVRARSEAVVFPGPAFMRLRRDVIDHLDLPAARVVAEERERFLVTVDGRGDAGPVPIGAVVFVHPGSGEAVLTRRSRTAVLPDLWNLTMKFPTYDDRGRCFQHLVDFAGTVPMWDLHRRLSFPDLPFVVERIVDTCLP
jgi:hypothetical protein